MMKLIYLTLLVTLFSGCDMMQSESQKEQKRVEKKLIFDKKVSESKEIQLKELDLKKELAEIEKAKILEKSRIEQQKVQAAFDQKLQEQEQRDSLEITRYLILSMTIILTLLSYFGFYYFKKKREDKLQAYNDNLKKYMQSKENEARMKIAEKMLDAISSGKLDKSQENQLIDAFTGEATGSYQKQLESTESSDEKEIIDVIEDKSER